MRGLETLREASSRPAAAARLPGAGGGMTEGGSGRSNFLGPKVGFMGSRMCPEPAKPARLAKSGGPFWYPR